MQNIFNFSNFTQEITSQLDNSNPYCCCALHVAQQNLQPRAGRQAGLHHCITCSGSRRVSTLSWPQCLTLQEQMLQQLCLWNS